MDWTLLGGMNVYNPYAPPAADVDALPDGAGLHRDGMLVRMELGSRFPDRCVRCDGPAQGHRLELATYWRPPWWRWTIWLTLLLLIIVSGLDPLIVMAFLLAILCFGVADVFVRKRIVVEYGLCGRHRRVRAQVMGGFVASWVLLLILLCAGIAGINTLQYAVAIGLPMFVLAIVASTLYRIRLARVTDKHMWLRGTGRPFYERLPAANGTA